MSRAGSKHDTYNEKMRLCHARVGSLVSLVVFVAAARPVAGQSAASFGAARSSDRVSLRVFLDCSAASCDADYLHGVLEYITYVRDPSVADVHILLTTIPTGSGGQVTTALFIGRSRFAGLTDTLTVTTAHDASDDDQRRAVARLLSDGLLRFAARTALARELTITYTPEPVRGDTKGSEHDPWNAWVYGIALTGQFSAQQYTQSGLFSGGITADRVTPGWKLDFSLGDAYSYSSINEGGVSTTTIQRTGLFSGQIARSVTSHWSAGVIASASNSTFNNELLVVHGAPALEYDVFPYAEATHHQLIILYAVGVSHFRYVDRTIFDRLQETRADQALSVAFGITEPWGGASAAIQGATFLDNVRSNREVVSADFHIRLFSGFSFVVDPSVTSIHDQIYLAAGTASRDDILLARRQLATNYQASLSMGFSFTFGSIYNGVVNPRFAKVLMAGS